jgi:hypothetical protein
MNNKKKDHWENVFQTKSPDQVSWTETYPQTSVDFIQAFQLDKNAPIVDIGGGDSLLVDALLDLGYTNLSVLDISAKALDRARQRLGERAEAIHWIENDILDFIPTKKYLLWHDRASFHFLTASEEIETYKEIVEKAGVESLVLGTFSTQGPEKCSGLPVKQYDCKSLANCFSEKFEPMFCEEIQHRTPFETNQEFIFTRFKKKIN